MSLNKAFFFSDNNRRLSQLFQIPVAFWFFRMVLPGMMYLFLPVFLLLVGFVFVFHRKDVFQKTYFFEFLKTFNPLIILGLFFVFAFFNSGRIYDRPLRDLFEYLVNLTFLVVFFTLTYRAREKS